MALSPLQERVAALVAALPESEPFVLAGGAAMAAHGVLDRRGVLVGAPVVAGQHPHDLELVAVGIGAVDALGGAVAGLTGVGARLLQRLADVGEFVDGVDLPGQVVQPDGAARLGLAGELAAVLVLPERGSPRNGVGAGSRAITFVPNTSV